MSIARAADWTLVGGPLSSTFTQGNDMVPFAGRLMADPAKTSIEVPAEEQGLNSSDAFSLMLSGTVSFPCQPDLVWMSFCPSSFPGFSCRSVTPILASPFLPGVLPLINRLSVSVIPVHVPLVMLPVARRAEVMSSSVWPATFEADGIGLAFLVALFDLGLTGIAGDSLCGMIGTAPDAEALGFPQAVFGFLRHRNSLRPRSVFCQAPKWARTIPIEIKD